ncbi:C39 family peptidase [Patescibacteria group bacterium]|nr:C39 family peptidase [Patescibacteria group bacterium]MCL5010469.1 C39 family peptidase [Patescibacteria group bacterium]
MNSLIESRDKGFLAQSKERPIDEGSRRRLLKIMLAGGLTLGETMIHPASARARELYVFPGTPENNPFYMIPETAETRAFLRNYGQKYGLSCEIASLKMCLGILGTEISEDYLLNAMPKNPDPNKGIRGNERLNGQTTENYGILAKGVKEFLNNGGGFRYNNATFKGIAIPVMDQNGQIDLNPMINALSRGTPLMVWATGGLVDTWKAEFYLPQGGYLRLPADEHCILIDGYNPETQKFRVRDPWKSIPGVPRPGTIEEYPDTAKLLNAMSYYEQPVLAVEALDCPVPLGHFYKSQDSESEEGFIIPSQILGQYQSLGGKGVLGGPISRLSKSGRNYPYLYQLTERGVLQYNPGNNSLALANTLDIFSENGWDWYLRFVNKIPRPIGEDGSHGDYAKAKKIRLGWLTDNAIEKAYLGKTENQELLGLPASFPQIIGEQIVQRFQRGAISYKEGKISFVWGSELIRNVGLFPGINYRPESLFSALVRQ